MTERTPLNDPKRDFYQVLADVVGSSSLETVAEKSYVLATIRHEAASRWRPITEFYPKFAPKQPLETQEEFESRRRLEIYNYFEGRYGHKTTVGQRLGNTRSGDGYTFRGRGFVQITGRANYHRLGKVLHMPLDENPDLALNWDTAINICIVGMTQGLFTGKKLSDYLGKHKPLDFKNARKVVNGLDRADTIAKYASGFYGTLMDLERLAG